MISSTLFRFKPRRPRRPKHRAKMRHRPHSKEMELICFVSAWPGCATGPRHGQRPKAWPEDWPGGLPRGGPRLASSRRDSYFYDSYKWHLQLHQQRLPIGCQSITIVTHTNCATRNSSSSAGQGGSHSFALLRLALRDVITALAGMGQRFKPD